MATAPPKQFDPDPEFASTLNSLRLLATRHPRSVQELADMAGRKQASVSRTLKRLAEAGIVAMARGRGRARRPELVATRVQLEIDLTEAKRKAVAVRP
jgi:predicted transcriptional regulator